MFRCCALKFTRVRKKLMSTRIIFHDKNYDCVNEPLYWLGVIKKVNRVQRHLKLFSDFNSTVTVTNLKSSRSSLQFEGIFSWLRQFIVWLIVWSLAWMSLACNDVNMSHWCALTMLLLDKIKLLQPQIRLCQSIGLEWLLDNPCCGRMTLLIKTYLDPYFLLFFCILS